MGVQVGQDTVALLHKASSLRQCVLVRRFFGDWSSVRASAQSRRLRRSIVTVILEHKSGDRYRWQSAAATRLPITLKAALTKVNLKQAVKRVGTNNAVAGVDGLVIDQPRRKE
jgi:hypothetical protein